MGFVADFISDVFDAAVSVVKGVVKAVANVVEAALKDPITTIAKVAAYATGNAWAIPLIDGASTLAKGGDLGDAIKVAAISYGTGKLATKVGTPVGKAAGEFAASQGATAATQKLVTNIMTRAAGNAAVAIVTQQDPVKAFVAGGATAAAPAILGKVSGFSDQPRWVQNALAATVGAAVAGQKDLTPVIAGELIKASDIVGNALRAFDPDGTKLTDGQRAIAADAIFKTTRAALSGGDVSAELTRSLTNGAIKALAEYAKDGIATATNAMSEQWAKINGTTDQLNSIVSKSEAAANQYNSVSGSLNAAIAEQNRLKSVMDAAVARHNSASDNTYLDEANRAVNAYNDYITSLNKAYNEYYRPELDRLSNELTAYDKQYQDLTGVLKKDQGKLQQEIDSLTNQLDPIYANSNRAFAEGLLPGFDAQAYRELNPNIPKDADPYLHYISTGQFQGLKATKEQLQQSTDILNAILDNPNVDQRALQEYVKSGMLTQQFVEGATKKKYNDLVDELNKRVTTEDEAKEFFKQVYGREAKTAAELAIVQEYTNIAEAASLRSMYATRQIEQDAKEFVYDGSNAKSQDAAESEAKSRGYNTYSFGGKIYTIMPSAEMTARAELVKKVLQEQGKNISTATDAEIQKAVDIVSKVPQQVVDTASIQDIIKGNYSGWKDGKYYSYAGNELQGVYAVDPATGNLTLEKLEVRGTGQDATLNPVVVRASSLQELAFMDPEAYLQMASQFDDRAKGDLGDFFTNSLSAAVLAAHATGNKTLANNLQQTLSIGSQGIGEQVQNLATFFASVTGTNMDSALIRAGKAMQEWGAANQSQSTKDQEAAIINAVSSTDGIANKIGAFVKASAENPLGFFTMVTKEAVQEVLPLWAARGVMTAGKLVAYSTNAAIEGLESWGSNAGEVYESAIRSGLSENEARALASKAGFQAFVVSSVANGIGDVPVVRKIIGDGVSASFGDLAKGTGREAVTEYFDELLTNANNQRILTGQVNWDQATTAATIASGIGAGTTAGILTGLNINQNAVVAKDMNGNNVTFKDFLAGTKEVNMSTLNLNANVATANDGDSVTIGGLAAMQMTSGLSYDFLKASTPAILSNQNIVIGKDALGNDVTIGSALGQVTEKQGFDQVYNNLLNTTADQRTEAQKPIIAQAFKDAGFTNFTAADIESLVNINNPGGTQAFIAQAQEYANPRVTTADEAREMMRSIGYINPTDEEIAEFVGSIPEAESQVKVGEYVAPRLVTEADARAFFQSRGYTPTDEEVKQFIRQGRDVVKTQVEEELGAYVDPRQVTAAEAREFFTSLGYQPTDEEIAQFVQQGPQVQQDIIRQALGEYVDPRFVTAEEARKAYEELGFTGATEADIQRLTGQYAQEELLGRTRDYLPIATYNATQAEIQRVADLVGKPARQVTQADIDYVNQMIQQGQQTDLSYDANRDGRIDQSDIDFMTRLIAGDINEPWTPQAGSAWGPTGLYAAQAEEAEKTRQQMAQKAEAARRLQLQGQMRQGIANVLQFAPQAIEQSYGRIKPIYSGTQYANFQAPLFQNNLWGQQPAGQTPTNQPNQFRMASGGYLDTQGDPQTWDDIYRMLK